MSKKSGEGLSNVNFNKTPTGRLRESGAKRDRPDYVKRTYYIEKALDRELKRFALDHPDQDLSDIVGAAIRGHIN